jgi:hypothetical protein
MKPLFHLDNGVEPSMFGVQKMRETIPRLYGGVGKGHLILTWGPFSYDKKGALHIWAPETAQDKKRAEEEITLLN